MSVLQTKTTARPLAYVLDDEAAIGALVGQFLTVCGYETKTFDTPLPFFTETRTGCPGLVVLDLALGESDAVDVIRHLEVLKYTGNVLLISGRDQTVLHDVEEIGKSHGLAMLPPLQKPFRLADLKASLAAIPSLAVKPTDAPKRAGVAITLEEALKNDWLEVWYQPKIDLRTRTFSGAEALVRARHPKHGLVMPADLLPPQHDPLYVPLTRFVLRRALRDWDRFADRGLFLKLSVNVPVSVLCTPGFIVVFRELIPRNPKFPGLIVEVAEDEIARDPDSIREIAAQLKICKVTLSIDDFGSAHSSLARLMEMPCSELKIEQQFVANSSGDAMKHALCASMVDLAHRVGITVCAKGIETAGELRTLIEVGCDAAQGFLFAKPMTADVLVDTLLKKRATTDTAPACVGDAAE